MSRTKERNHGTESNSGLLTISEQHEVLSSGRRRRVLSVLSESNLPIDVAELARAVSTREYESDESDEQRERLQIELHHVHLPKLQELNVVDYDKETCQVETYRPFQ
ncbi:DUF7344 domain-containing protein [Salinibaculum salinum]|uniref:DUF7344 domain-containing protein n=1 Tax=Salinibaculum salinum TaxID=3131996 RepID=UPI0030EB4408